MQGQEESFKMQKEGGVLWDSCGQLPTTCQDFVKATVLQNASKKQGPVQKWLFADICKWSIFQGIWTLTEE